VHLIRRRRPAARARALLVATLTGLVLFTPDRASAHAALVDSDPPDGATLTSAPARVTLTFDEAIGRPAYVVVTAPDGTRVDVGAAEPVDATVTQRLDPSAAPAQAGRWTVAFRVVSVDGHPVSDELSFTVEGGPRSDRPAAYRTTGVLADEPPFWREHVGLIALGAGGVLIAALLVWWPTGRRRHA